MAIRIGICGAVSAGKSTLINAIFGDIVSNTGIGRTTTTVNHMKYTGQDISYPVTIIDTPGSSDIELGVVRNASFLALQSCHIIIHVVDLVDYAKPTSDLTAKVNAVINKVVSTSSIGKNIIRVVNKGDYRSEEYNTILARIKREFKNVVAVHAAAACIRNFSGNIENHKIELKNIANSFTHPKVCENLLSSAVLSQITQEFLAAGNDLTGFDKLIAMINSFIANRQHEMLIDTAKSKYFALGRPTFSQKLDHYNEIRQICNDLGKPYKGSYTEHIVYDEICKIC